MSWEQGRDAKERTRTRAGSAVYGPLHGNGPGCRGSQNGNPTDHRLWIGGCRLGACGGIARATARVNTRAVMVKWQRTRQATRMSRCGRGKTTEQLGARNQEERKRSTIRKPWCGWLQPAWATAHLSRGNSGASRGGRAEVRTRSQRRKLVQKVGTDKGISTGEVDYQWQSSAYSDWWGSLLAAAHLWPVGGRLGPGARGRQLK